MLVDRFLEAVGELGDKQLAGVIYSGDEPLIRFKMNITSVNTFDDEIVIYGEDNDFIILCGEPTMVHDEEEDKIVFLFTNSGQKIEIEFPN